MNLPYGASGASAQPGASRRALLLALGAATLWTAGCASPGHPSPPSLQVPRLVTDLTAARAGDQVHLRWTTPARTTDGIDARAPITAEICRSSPNTAIRNPQSGSPPTCTVVGRLTVPPGISETDDTLPPTLTTGPARLLAYQVQLRGALGKTAGPSPAAYTASGTAPAPVAALHATDTARGALLQWTADPGNSQAVELTRTLVSAAPHTSSASTAGKDPSRTSNPFRPRSPEVEPATPGTTRLSAGAVDSGGVVDRTAELGATYDYSAQRVQTLHLGSRTVELRSTPSAPVTLAVRDVFPPATPAGLLATPGPGSIDLSWEPGTEARLAGYRVYRADPGAAGSSPHAWQRLTPDPIPVPAYRDLSALPGRTYRYRVTALDTTGNESPPSPEVTETLP